MLNHDNSSSLRTEVLPATATDADPATADSLVSAVLVARYGADVGVSTPQEAVLIAGRSFAVTRIDGVSLAGEPAVPSSS
jgi:hypothetical protein